MANRIAVKVCLSDTRYNYVTEVNGTIEDARRYFVGQDINVGSVEDRVLKCLDVVDVTSYKRFRVSFHGRTKGAIGICYRITDNVWAQDVEGARLALYDKYEQIHRVYETVEVSQEGQQ
jgi:hypothetical protein